MIVNGKTCLKISGKFLNHLNTNQNKEKELVSKNVYKI